MDLKLLEELRKLCVFKQACDYQDKKCTEPTGEPCKSFIDKEKYKREPLKQKVDDEE